MRSCRLVRASVCLYGLWFGLVGTGGGEDWVGGYLDAVVHVDLATDVNLPDVPGLEEAVRREGRAACGGVVEVRRHDGEAADEELARGMRREEFAWVVQVVGSAFEVRDLDVLSGREVSDGKLGSYVLHLDARERPPDGASVVQFGVWKGAYAAGLGHAPNLHDAGCGRE